MNLTKTLRSQGYDLIGGPIRNHNALQLWLKEPSEEAQYQYATVGHAFVSPVVLTEIESPSLAVNATTKDEYGFNIGLTVLDELLKSIGLATLELSAKLKFGKTVTISYDHALTRECTRGNVEDYLSQADFVHANPVLLKHANRNRILIITGVIMAKNLLVDIETDFTVDAAVVAELNKVATGKLNFSIASNTKLKMTSSGDQYFPIAVKAYRIDFDRNVFQRLTLMTDNRNIF
ncbi:hypothetical protein WG904_18695 [Pedobacter sp. Du54]|uniref:gasdermin n=1 Tax=Pedobacter anseongensis TaxID=3133439 RepID=UPI003096F9BF